MLKASVSNEGRINVLLWYCLFGTYVGSLPGFALGVSCCTWYGGDGPHLSCRPLSSPVRAVQAGLGPLATVARSRLAVMASPAELVVHRGRGVGCGLAGVG